MQKFLFDIWPLVHYCLTRIHHGQLVFAIILENFDAQISFCIAACCSHASNGMRFTLCKTTVCLRNINWICGLNMALILNGFYYNSFHLTATLTLQCNFPNCHSLSMLHTHPDTYTGTHTPDNLLPILFY